MDPFCPSRPLKFFKGKHLFVVHLSPTASARPFGESQASARQEFCRGLVGGYSYYGVDEQEATEQEFVEQVFGEQKFPEEELLIKRRLSKGKLSNDKNVFKIQSTCPSHVHLDGNVDDFSFLLRVEYYY